MRTTTLRRSRRQALPGLTGVARLDRHTKDLTKRLHPGDIAVIDHIDLDRASADALVAAEVAAVVNVSPSISGRYPNLGPEVLVRAGIPLVDDVGADVFVEVREGDRLRLDDRELYRGQQFVATGHVQTVDSVARTMVAARAGLAAQLEAFASNAMEYLRHERELLLEGVGVPDIRTELAGRHVLVVMRGYDYRQDLAALRPYIKEYRPVLIAVDGGADALREAGYRPDLIVGDMDTVSEAALRCGAELVVHCHPDGRAPGLVRVRDLRLPAVTFSAAAGSEDVALLLADAKDATLIVVAGTHASLVEFLEQGRAGMASSFLTRLRLGGKLIDAKGVQRLYRRRIHAWSLVALALAALLVVASVLVVTPAGSPYLAELHRAWHHAAGWVTGWWH